MPDFLSEVLTWPNNYGYYVAVKTAYQAHLPPSMFFTDSQPSDGWTKADKKLYMAYQILQDETCPHCGNPIWLCKSSERNLGFKVKINTCYSKLESDKWQDNSRNNLKAGQYISVSPTMYNGESIPSGLRAQFMKEQAED